jgi:glucose/arabinose dehydrogenase
MYILLLLTRLSTLTIIQSQRQQEQPLPPYNTHHHTAIYQSQYVYKNHKSINQQSSIHYNNITINRDTHPSILHPTTTTTTTSTSTDTSNNNITTDIRRRVQSNNIVRRINCGGPIYIDQRGQKWSEDTKYTKGGTTYSKTVSIENTLDDILYQTYRFGQFVYEIPIPNGDYEIIFYFAELNVNTKNERIFSISVQDTIVYNKIDILLLGKSKKYNAIQLESVGHVIDGKLRIGFIRVTNQPFISAIEITYIKPHVAHAVTNGPYYGVDIRNNNKAIVRVDGSLSHTHGIGLSLETMKWKLGTRTIGIGEITDLTLPVGEHLVTLYVTDTGGNTNFDTTTITVFPFGYPTIDDIYPTSGNIAGGSIVTIDGYGFNVSDNSLVIRFGKKPAAKKDINIINDNRIKVKVPSFSVDVPVDLTVETSKGISNAVKFTYVSGSPIAFTSTELGGFQIGLPTVLTFDVNGILYIATSDGKIARLKLNDDFTVVKGYVVSSVLSGRAILGIAADPMNTQSGPAIYVSHSTLFHGESKSTSGLAINGKVSRIEGANLDVVVDVITNLPVSDHDHAVNGLEFGDHGELYIQVGGNTNAGVPGRLSGTRLLKENPLSAATLVAYLSDPTFDGNIQYDAPDDGNIIGGKGIKVFASGQRNSFDITLHSNGNLYATDNGPNVGFGKRSTGCGSNQEGDDADEKDKLNLILQGRHYGHPNRKRGEKDKRQCKWRSVNEPSNAEFKGPMMSLPSSTTGIIEFQTNQFEGQLRHNLILSYVDHIVVLFLTMYSQRQIL